MSVVIAFFATALLIALGWQLHKAWVEYEDELDGDSDE